MSRDYNQIGAHLETWYGGNNGAYLKASLRDVIAPILDVAFGYHILQIGVAQGLDLFCQSRISHRIYISEQVGAGVNLLSRNDELPLESDSIDTVIAHHSLEFGPDPHAVLREIQRVLAPQGHLIVVGFNPYSLLGGAAAIRRFGRQPLWQEQHPVSRHRASDWLQLLGCEVQSCNYLYSLPPMGTGVLNRWSSTADAWSNKHNLATGGLYILHAIKQVSALNKPRLGLRERGGRLIGLAVPKPVATPSPTPSVTGSTQAAKIMEKSTREAH
jgi:SAM-dependent methyltransferase